MYTGALPWWRSIPLGASYKVSARADAAWRAPADINAIGSFSALRQASEIKLTILISIAMNSISDICTNVSEKNNSILVGASRMVVGDVFL